MAQLKNNSAFIEVEQQGAQNEPRIELLEGPFVHGCQALENGMGGYIYMGFYTGGDAR